MAEYERTMSVEWSEVICVALLPSLAVTSGSGPVIDSLKSSNCKAMCFMKYAEIVDGYSGKFVLFGIMS